MSAETQPRQCLLQAAHDTRCDRAMSWSTASGEIAAMHGLGARQRSESVPQVQGAPCSRRCCSPKGAHRRGEEGPNKAIVGTPSPAARCNGPVSPPMNNRARLSTARKIAKSGNAGSTGTAGTCLLNSTKRACSRGWNPEQNTILRPAAKARR